MGCDEMGWDGGVWEWQWGVGWDVMGCDSGVWEWQWGVWCAPNVVDNALHDAGHAAQNYVFKIPYLILACPSHVFRNPCTTKTIIFDSHVFKKLLYSEIQCISICAALYILSHIYGIPYMAYGTGVNHAKEFL